MKHLTKVPQGTNRAAMLYEAAPKFLSEQEVLALYPYFFSPGFHCIKVPTVEAGRSLFEKYTLSVGHVVDSAFLTTMPLSDDFYNLYDELHVADMLSEEKGYLEEFVLRSINHDFLIIEATAELLKSTWFGIFEQLLIDYNIMKETTIIMFMY
ncbi:hypothetical protein H0W26_00060 [Candidatus Dependentiae bacterium]|nr:hypothetical protein [Candidatus Dependentiae bacterium]